MFEQTAAGGYRNESALTSQKLLRGFKRTLSLVLKLAVLKQALVPVVLVRCNPAELSSGPAGFDALPFPRTLAAY